jgi:DNA ligase (NAD+)
VEKGRLSQIIAVDLSERPENSEHTKYISHCPECQTELVRNEGEVNHYCPTMDVLHIIGRIQHYISRKAMDIEGLGGETVALLFNNDLVHNYADLYKLTVEQIPLERMAQNLPITW